MYLFQTYLLIELAGLTWNLLFALQQEAGRMEGMASLGASSPEKVFTLLGTWYWFGEKLAYMIHNRDLFMFLWNLYLIPPKGYSLLGPKVRIHDRRLSVISPMFSSLRSPLIGLWDSVSHWWSETLMLFLEPMFILFNRQITLMMVQSLQQHLFSCNTSFLVIFVFLYIQFYSFFWDLDSLIYQFQSYDIRSLILIPVDCSVLLIRH